MKHTIVVYPDGFICTCHWRWMVDTTKVPLEDASTLRRIARDRHDADQRLGLRPDEGWVVAMSPAFRPARLPNWSRAFSYDRLGEIHDAVFDVETEVMAS